MYKWIDVTLFNIVRSWGGGRKLELYVKHTRVGLQIRWEWNLLRKNVTLYNTEFDCCQKDTLKSKLVNASSILPHLVCFFHCYETFTSRFCFTIHESLIGNTKRDHPSVSLNNQSTLIKVNIDTVRYLSLAWNKYHVCRQLDNNSSWIMDFISWTGCPPWAGRNLTTSIVKKR